MKNIEICQAEKADLKLSAQRQSENDGQNTNWWHRLQKNTIMALFLMSGFLLCACGEEPKSGSVGTNCSEKTAVSSEDAEEYYDEEEEYDEYEEECEDEEYEEDFEEETVQKKATAPKPVKKNVAKKQDPNYDAGMKAFNAGEGLEAIRLFKVSGSAQSTYMLGVIYEVGCGNVGANPMMAKKFYKKAAAMGSEEAQDKL